jgi:type IV pilus assembly protein PilE
MTRRTRQTHIRTFGFTLVELMVVLLIVAILAAVALPMYQSEVRESRRTDAKTAVLDLAAREEKYFSLNNNYTGSPINLGYASTSSSATFPQNVGSGYYQINVCVQTATVGQVTATACTTSTGNSTSGNTYVIAVIPVAGKSQANDSTCQYFAIDNTGNQFASSTEGIGTDTTTTCWH